MEQKKKALYLKLQFHTKAETTTIMFKVLRCGAPVAQ